MKIIRVDNFDRETISDALVCDNVAIGYSEMLVEALNSTFGGEYSSDFFKLVDDDYVLYQYDPNN